MQLAQENGQLRGQLCELLRHYDAYLGTKGLHLVVNEENSQGQLVETVLASSLDKALDVCQLQYTFCGSLHWRVMSGTTPLRFSDTDRQFLSSRLRTEVSTLLATAMSTAANKPIMDALSSQVGDDNLLNSLNDAIVIIDEKGIVKYVNAVITDVTGFTQQELLNAPVNKLMPEPYASQHDGYLSHYVRTGDAKIMGIGRQLPGIKKSGELYQMELSLTETVMAGERRFIGVIRDISERIKAEDKIYQLAYVDARSGLKNQNWFRRELGDFLRVAAQKAHCIYVLVIDIDRMGQINLQRGMLRGNEIIADVARAIQQVAQGRFWSYQYEADSYLLVCSDTYLENEIDAFEKESIEAALLNPSWYHFGLGGLTHDVSVSVGSFIGPAKQLSVDGVLSALDYANKRAKQLAPFGRYHLDAGGLHDYRRQVSIVDRLKHVSQSGELALALQPQYDEKGLLVASEVLVRWHSPELGFVSPAEFIPMAERYGAIVSIGDWVMARAFSLLATLNAKGVNTHLAVNISGRQIIQPDFVSKVQKLLSEYQVFPSQLTFELTETALVTDVTVVKDVMLDLSKIGISFSIDDFGTGYSSLRYLKALPINEIKIDKYFIDGIDEADGRAQQRIINLIIGMAKALGATTVAEGVETASQVAYLKQHGCSRFQGYYFSKPLSEEAWVTLVSGEGR